MSEDNKKAWCGFNGWQPVAHTYDGAAYMAPINASEEAWGKIKETISNAKPGEFYTFDADGNASLTMGDTPEQSADAIMIDGKIVTREDVRRLQSEHDALAATVEALRKTIIEYDDCDTASQSKKACSDMIALAKATPQQHLRDVRAEAVIDAVVSHETKYGNSQFGRHLREYAERVKAGE